MPPCPQLHSQRPASTGGQARSQRRSARPRRRPSRDPLIAKGGAHLQASQNAAARPRTRRAHWNRPQRRRNPGSRPKPTNERTGPPIRCEQGWGSDDISLGGRDSGEAHLRFPQEPGGAHELPVLRPRAMAGLGRTGRARACDRKRVGRQKDRSIPPHLCKLRLHPLPVRARSRRSAGQCQKRP